METNNTKELNGKYGFSTNFDRVCTCGHTLGEHTAPNGTSKRPCLECDCKHIRVSK